MMRTILALGLVVSALGCGEDDSGPCASAEVLCDGFCARLSDDAMNCGACGTTCGATESCQSGMCTEVGAVEIPECSTGETLCDSRCVDTEIDERHCGACGTACAAGESCSSGSCALACPAGFAACGSECIDTDSDASHCGACDTACTGGEVCASGACALVCPPGLSTCGASCVDLATNAMHCGDCDSACAIDGAIPACAGGACFFATCAPGFFDLDDDTENGCEVDSSSDLFNCGGVAQVCAFGQECVESTCQDLPEVPTSVVFAGIDTDACERVEHATSAGDDRGGIAAGASYYYYTGDSGQTRVDAADMGNEMRIRQDDSVFSDLRTGVVYSFTVGGSPDNTGGTFDGFVELNPETFEVVEPVIALSESIATSGRTGIFAGLDRVVLVTDGNAYSIAIDDGTVTDLGEVDVDDSQTCENWAFWGAAETNADGSTALVYARSGSVIRRQVGDGTTEEVFSEPASDLCSLTFDLSRQRMVFHYEGGGFAGSGDEGMYYCAAMIASP